MAVISYSGNITAGREFRGPSGINGPWTFVCRGVYFSQASRLQFFQVNRGLQENPWLSS